MFVASGVLLLFCGWWVSLWREMYVGKIPDVVDYVVREAPELPWPNPALPGSDQVHFPYSLPQRGKVALLVYDARGGLVALRESQPFAAGEQAIFLSTARLPSGVYFVRLTTDSGLTASARWTADVLLRLRRQRRGMPWLGAESAARVVRGARSVRSFRAE